MEREGTISQASKNKGRLKIVLGFTLLYLIVEVVGGMMTKSLALLADAGHMLTSIGVIVAGIIMMTTGWYYADPLLSAGIGLFILPRTWILLKESIGILLEGTPKDVNMAELRSSMLLVEGVEEMHDLHVWVLTSGVNAMTAHVVLKEGAEGKLVLSALQKHITENFKISHTTLQLEEPGFKEEQTPL